MFEKLKKEIQETIKNSTEVTNNTNYKNSGIYMLYIDNFSDNSILPIYIGQAENFQNRFSDHLKEIMALNRLEYNIYREIFLKLFYDGHFKACKMFKFLIEHKCSLKDVHMIILEEVDKKNLDIKEQEYFNIYHPEFFGFNQLNTASLQLKDIPLKSYLEYIYNDSINIKKFYNYGYTKNNYLLTFYKEPLSEKSFFRYSNKGDSVEQILNENKSLLVKINENISYLSQKYNTRNFEKYNCLIPKLQNKKNTLKNKITEKQEKLKKSCKKELTQFFNDNNLNIPLKYEDAISSIVYDSTYSYDSFQKYLKNKKIKDNIVDILKNKYKKEKNNIDNIISQYSKTNRLLSKIYRVETHFAVYNFLPNIKYSSFPLKDCFIENTFTFKNLSYNECHINIEYTNHGRNKHVIPEPIKIDYMLKTFDSIIQKRDIFLHTQLDTFFDQDIHKYIEKDFFDNYKLYKQPFNIVLGTMSGKKDIYNDYISISSEYNTGINEYTLKNKEKTYLYDILKEISLKINDKTKIIYTTSSSKRLFIDYVKDKKNIKYLNNIEHNLINKIIKNIR